MGTAALLLALLMAPNARALTGGPSAPERKGFTPIETTDLVDLFTGDFQYNIPLLEVGGYPINLGYAGAVLMDDEASMVGLGWSLNPGGINITTRGIPDSFDGTDKIEQRTELKPNWTVGLTGLLNIELFGSDGKKTLGKLLTKFKEKTDTGMSLSAGLNWNNYQGFGFTAGIDPSIAAAGPAKSSLTADLGLSANGTAGIGISPNVSMSWTKQVGGDSGMLGLKLGCPINSQEGLKALSFGAVAKISTDNVDGDPVDIAAMNGGSSIDFAWPTQSPQIDFPMSNQALRFRAAFGPEINGGQPKYDVSGFYSVQYLATNVKKVPAYGYLHLGKGAKDPAGQLDFNREGDGGFSRDTPALPRTVLTYDIYSVSGQGVGGTYRPFRSELGHVFDPEVLDSGTDGDMDISVAVELGGGNTVKGGVDLTQTTIESRSGDWTNSNHLTKHLDFAEGDEDNTLYEPVWFRMAGEKVAESDPAFAQLGGLDGDAAARVGLSSKPGVYMLPYFVAGSDDSETAALGTKWVADGNGAYPRNKRIPRAARNQVFSWLRGDQANEFGLVKAVESYALGKFEFAKGSDRYEKPPGKARTDDNRGHHMSEVTILQPGGTRVVFGIPAYSLKEVDATFAVDPPDSSSGVCEGGLIDYEADAYGTPKPGTGSRDEFLSIRTTPAHPTSFLISAVLSADYEDRTGDGPTPDDHGRWTRFNYTRYSDELDGGVYRWRVPVEANKANYNEGFRSDPKDDKASVLYGEREDWYLHSVESENEVAEFHYSTRNDSLGVRGRAGGADDDDDNQRRLKLDSIELYARRDKVVAVQKATVAVPIKVVHFSYDYSLARGIPNSMVSSTATAENGKLTLRKVWFTYGSSQKAAQNPYAFRYGDANHDGTEDWGKGGAEAQLNPPYNLKAYDRWGRYKPHSGSCDIAKPPPPWEDPWVYQDGVDVAETSADRQAAAWLLSDIELPAGGSIEVDYEADDYAYVQTHRAMAMFPLTGAGDDPIVDDPDEHAKYGTKKGVVYHYLYFAFPEPIDPSAGGSTNLTELDAWLTAQLLRDDDEVAFRSFVNLGDEDGGLVNEIEEAGGQGDAAAIAEFVPGWAEVDPGLSNSNAALRHGAGVLRTSKTGGKYTHGWIRVKDVPLSDREGDDDRLHPISKAAMQLIRLRLPRLAYGQFGYEADTMSLQSLLDAFVSLVDQLEGFIEGFCRMMRNRGQGLSFEPNRSWVRLYLPSGFKEGGGARVQQITLRDAAGPGEMNMAEKSHGYVQQYSYTREEGDRLISSGVASWEPMTGGEETAGRYAEAFSNDRKLAPDDSLYAETPFGEVFYPSPSVGYGRVVVSSPYDKVTKHGTGAVVHEFYTTADHPTRTSHTGMEAIREKPFPLLSFLKVDAKDYTTAAQGFSVVLNDMNGKPKSETVLDQKGQEISAVEYYYRLSEISSSLPPDSQHSFTATRLDNRVPTLNPAKQGTALSWSEVGVDTEVVLDTREHRTETTASGANANLDTFMIPFVPPAPMLALVILPTYSHETVQFRSAVTTKVVQRYGILDHVVARDLGSSVSTENLAWDGVTGEVLATRTANAFDDPVYHFTEPAHWPYEAGMGPAFHNVGATWVNVDFVAGQAAGLCVEGGVPVAADHCFTPGDELALSSGEKGWVLSTSGGAIQVVDRLGATLDGTQLALSIVRSGRRNLQSTPVAAVSALTCPLLDTDFDQVYDHFDPAFSTTYAQSTGVLDASAGEFRDDWGLFCGTSDTTSTEECVCDESAVLMDLQSLLAGLLKGDSLLLLPDDQAKGVEVMDGSTLSYGLTSSLVQTYTAQTGFQDNTLVWSAPFEPGSAVLHGMLAGGSGSGPCPVELTLPSGADFDWTDLFSGGLTPSFSSISAVPNGQCDDTSAFTIALTVVDDITKQSTAWAVNGTSCLTTPCEMVAVEDDWSCGIVPGDTINPYYHGVLGNWRPWRSYAYKVDRSYTTPFTNGPPTTKSARNAGTYAAFTPFWAYTESTNTWKAATPAQSEAVGWKWTSQITEVHPKGMELENEDALHRFSAAVFGYRDLVPMAVASNARYRQIAVEDFEEEIDGGISRKGAKLCRLGHFDFHDQKDLVTDEEAHTGDYSIGVSPLQPARTERPLTTSPCEATWTPKPVFSTYTVHSCDCIGTCAPLVDTHLGSRYILVYWVKESGSVPTFDFTAARARVLILDKNAVETDLTDSVTQPAFRWTRSSLVEGWQRHEMEFEIPAAATGSFAVVLENSTGSTAWFDDIAIHPADSLMKTFVYDPRTLDLRAELDENHYATLYEYDQERTLVRVKKETERGIMTLQETRSHITKPGGGSLGQME